jgi:hypothetical protein
MFYCGDCSVYTYLIIFLFPQVKNKLYHCVENMHLFSSVVLSLTVRTARIMFKLKNKGIYLIECN